jgi:hypothetical protein
VLLTGSGLCVQIRMEPGGILYFTRPPRARRQAARTSGHGAWPRPWVSMDAENAAPWSANTVAVSLAWTEENQ